MPSRDDAKLDAIHDPPSVDEYGVAEPIERPDYKPAIIPGLNHTYESDLDVDANTYRDSNASYQSGRGTKGRHFDDDEDKLTMAERPKLPSNPMTTKIFSIFADPSAITWFITLTLGIAVVVGCFTMSIMGFAGQDNPGVTFLGAVCTGAGLLFGLMVFYFATNCFLCILQDSAAGNDIIESWPDKEGGGFSGAGFSFTFAALFYSGGIGLLLTWPLRNSGTEWFLALFGIGFFLFPLSLVMALETGSPMAPISINIIRSFLARLSTWVTFFIESAILCAVGLGITFLLIAIFGARPKMLSVICALVLGPIFTFLLFIYFRLLGRLAWVCDDWFRSLEKEEDEEDNDERERDEIAYYDDEV